MKGGSNIKGDLKQFGFIFLGLFVIAILVGITYVGLGYFNASLCTSAGGDEVWTYTNGQCLNSTGSEQTVSSINAVNVVQNGLAIALGLLGLVVIMLVFRIILRVVKELSRDF